LEVREVWPSEISCGLPWLFAIKALIADQRTNARRDGHGGEEERNEREKKEKKKETREKKEKEKNCFLV